MLRKIKRHIQKLNSNNIVEIPTTRQLQIQIEGVNNTVKIYNDKFKGSIQIFGDNNTFILHDGYDAKLNVSIGVSKERRTNNCHISIGKDLYCGSATIVIGEDNFIMHIGNDCMFSENIDIYGTDGHTITGKNGNILNIGQSIYIGDHVWVGKDVKINKNTSIPANSVIGWSSVVTKKFTSPNVTIAGNPAKIVKTDVLWHRTFPNLYKK